MSNEELKNEMTFENLELEGGKLDENVLTQGQKNLEKDIQGAKKVKDTVELSREDFQGLMANVERMSKKIEALETGEVQELPDVAKVKKAKIHLYKDQVVTNVGTAWEVDDEYGEPELRLEIYIGDKKYEVNHKAFTTDEARLGFTSEDAEIKEVKMLDESYESQGYTDLVEVDYANFRSKAVGKVPLKVVTPKCIYIMKRANGEEIEVNPLALN